MSAETQEQALARLARERDAAAAELARQQRLIAEAQKRGA